MLFQPERVQPFVNIIISSEADKPVNKLNLKRKETTDQAEVNNNLTLTKKQLSIISNIDLAGLTHIGTCWLLHEIHTKLL